LAVINLLVAFTSEEAIPPIFASAVTLMLTLFNQTLQIYRKTEGIRQATQSVRATLEFIVKEAQINICTHLRPNLRVALLKKIQHCQLK
jgi:hypothetical protein